MYSNFGDGINVIIIYIPYSLLPLKRVMHRGRRLWNIDDNNNNNDKEALNSTITYE